MAEGCAVWLIAGGCLPRCHRVSDQWRSCGTPRIYSAKVQMRVADHG